MGSHITWVHYGCTDACSHVVLCRPRDNTHWCNGTCSRWFGNNKKSMKLWYKVANAFLGQCTTQGKGHFVNDADDYSRLEESPKQSLGRHHNYIEACMIINYIKYIKEHAMESPRCGRNVDPLSHFGSLINEPSHQMSSISSLHIYK